MLQHVKIGKIETEQEQTVLKNNYNIQIQSICGTKLETIAKYFWNKTAEKDMIFKHKDANYCNTYVTSSYGIVFYRA